MKDSRTCRTTNKKKTLVLYLCGYGSVFLTSGLYSVGQVGDV